MHLFRDMLKEAAGAWVGASPPNAVMCQDNLEPTRASHACDD